MGGMGYWQEKAEKDLLISLFNGKYECAVRLVGTDKETGKPLIGEYKLYEKFNREEIIEYAKTTSEKSDGKVSKIEILALKPLSIEEIPIEDSDKK